MIQLLPRLFYTIILSLITLNAISEPLHITLCENAIPPYIIANNNKIEEHSILAKEMHEIFDAIPEINYSLQLLPWKRCLAMVKKGTIDGVLMFAKTEEREKHFIYSDVSMYYHEGIFYSKAKYPDGFHLNSFDELKKYQLGMLLGHVYDPAIEEMRSKSLLSEQLVRDTPQNIKKLLNGRIDLFFEGAFNTRYRIFQMGLHEKIALATTTPPMKYDQFMGFHPKSPVIKYLPLINNRLKELRESGRLTELLFFEEYYQ